jgi:hypothetical protein
MLQNSFGQGRCPAGELPWEATLPKAVTPVRLTLMPTVTAESAECVDSTTLCLCFLTTNWWVLVTWLRGSAGRTLKELYGCTWPTRKHLLLLKHMKFSHCPGVTGIDQKLLILTAYLSGEFFSLWERSSMESITEIMQISVSHCSNYTQRTFPNAAKNRSVQVTRTGQVRGSWLLREWQPRQKN